MPSTASTTKRCPHCGAELKARTAELFGKTVTMGYEECQCQGARAEREAREREEARREAEERRKRVAEAVRRAGILPRYERANHPMASRCAEHMAKGGNVYVYGNVGTHKTTLAAATARLLVEQGRDVRFTAMWRVLDAIKDGFRGGTDPLPGYQRAGFLFLDDLGKESPTDFALERLFALVDERNARMLPTLVTTQYKPSALIGRLAKNGDRDTAVAIVSRLRQDCRTVELDGPDGRLA